MVSSVKCWDFFLTDGARCQEPFSVEFLRELLGVLLWEPSFSKDVQRSPKNPCLFSVSATIPVLQPAEGTEAILAPEDVQPTEERSFVPRRLIQFADDARKCPLTTWRPLLRDEGFEGWLLYPEALPMRAVSCLSVVVPCFPSSPGTRQQHGAQCIRQRRNYYSS